MKTSARRASAFGTAFLSVVTIVQAHPGHDDHELTWDFAHLVEHPLATAGCVALVGIALAVIVGWHRRRTSDQSAATVSADRN